MLSLLVTSIVITVVIALVLIFTNGPKPFETNEGLDFSGQLGGDVPPMMPEETVQMRDGHPLPVRRYPSTLKDAPLLVLVHGSGWHGMQFYGLAQRLQTVADVVVPDLRGHGAAPGTRGDVAYIGQLEDDLADLIAATQLKGQKVVLGGHSSGGGLVVRFAGGAHSDLLDGAVLMAPCLRHSAPMTREASGGWAHVLLRRIIGLSMLNTFRILLLNHLPIIEFNMPRAVMEGPLGATATTSYSYRLNTSFAPRRDYLADVGRLPALLLLVGAQDEAFIADLYEPTLTPATEMGRYVTIDGVGHLALINAPVTASEIMRFLKDS